MQSSPRARRESPATAPETAAAVIQTSGKRGWVPGFARLFNSKPAAAKTPDSEVNPLLAFPSEAAARLDAASAAESIVEPASATNAGKRPVPIAAVSHPQTYVRPLLIAAAVVGVVALGVLAIQRFPRPQFMSSAPQSGNLTIETQPAGSEVLVDGERRGATPLKLALAPGAHTVTIRNARDERIVPLTMTAGADITHYFEMKTAAAPAVVGRLSVVTDPPGARVAVDGKPRGISPITVADLTAEDHKVTVTSEGGLVERVVAVAAGTTASVMFSLPKTSGPVGGWLSISAPFDVEIVEHEDVLGTSGTTRIMLAAGRHDIVLANRSIGFEETRTIEVTAGKTAAVRVEPPKVSVSVNARPWAEITVDGNNAGQTPIANLMVSVGPHEMVFRHPQFGERKQTVMVTAKGPNRIAVDLAK
jgi:eukaryotic-like serine/threonine-protein kinase